jgi:hypothetical protein
MAMIMRRRFGKTALIFALLFEHGIRRQSEAVQAIAAVDRF